MQKWRYLVLFLMLGSRVYTPGVRLELPVAEDVPGTDKPMVAVAIDARGRLFFENQVIGAGQLQNRLRQVVNEAGRPLTLLVQADKGVTYGRLVELTQLARQAGISEAWLAALPRPLAPAP